MEFPQDKKAEDIPIKHELRCTIQCSSIPSTEATADSWCLHTPLVSLKESQPIFRCAYAALRGNQDFCSVRFNALIRRNIYQSAIFAEIFITSKLFLKSLMVDKKADHYLLPAAWTASGHLTVGLMDINCKCFNVFAFRQVCMPLEESKVCFWEW